MFVCLLFFSQAFAMEQLECLSEVESRARLWQVFLYVCWRRTWFDRQAGVRNGNVSNGFSFERLYQSVCDGFVWRLVLGRDAPDAKSFNNTVITNLVRNSGIFQFLPCEDGKRLMVIHEEAAHAIESFFCYNARICFHPVELPARRVACALCMAYERTMMMAVANNAAAAAAETPKPTQKKEEAMQKSFDAASIHSFHDSTAEGRSRSNQPLMPMRHTCLLSDTAFPTFVMMPIATNRKSGQPCALNDDLGHGLSGVANENPSNRGARGLEGFPVHRLKFFFCDVLLHAHVMWLLYGCGDPCLPHQIKASPFV